MNLMKSLLVLIGLCGVVLLVMVPIIWPQTWAGAILIGLLGFLCCGATIQEWRNIG